MKQRITIEEYNIKWESEFNKLQTLINDVMEDGIYYKYIRKDKLRRHGIHAAYSFEIERCHYKTNINWPC